MEDDHEEWSDGRNTADDEDDPFFSFVQYD